jgi:hypothetical protein
VIPDANGEINTGDGTKEQYKSLRIQLAELAEIRRLPEDLLDQGG